MPTEPVDLSQEICKGEEDEVDQSLYAEALYASPVEWKLFRQYTRRPGLFFKTFRMERMFLDGYAKLNRNVVYIGYVFVLLSYVLDILFHNLKDSNFTKLDVQSCWEMLVPLLPTIAACFVVGCLVHWIIHRMDRVREKSWAILAAWLVYLVLLLSTFLYEFHDMREKLAGGTYAKVFPWMTFFYHMNRIFPAFVFLSGSPSFLLYFLLCIVAMAIAGAAYPVCQALLADAPGTESTKRSYALTEDSLENMYYALVYVILSLCGTFYMETLSRKQFLQGLVIGKQQDHIIRQKSQNTKMQKRLLQNILPPTILDQLQEYDYAIHSWDQLRSLSRRYFGVSILFAELVGFPDFCKEFDPPDVLEYLNDLFCVFEGLCVRHDVYKVETVGDQYVAAVGVVTGKIHTEHACDNALKCDSDVWLSTMTSVGSLRDSSSSNTAQMLGFARAMILASGNVRSPSRNHDLALRVGVHTGSCIGGLVGTKNSRFCLFGDAMNTAARMEQHGTIECIHVTQDVVDLVPEEGWEKLDEMEIKGKGCMQTYLLRIFLSCRGAYGSAVDDDDDIVDSISSQVQQDTPVLFLAQDEDALHCQDAGGLRLDPTGGINLDDVDFQDVRPVDHVAYYKEHTFCFGLFFKRLSTERTYMDGQARLDKGIVYFGHLLFLLIFLLSLLQAFLSVKYNMNACNRAISDHPKNDSFIKEYCSEDELGALELNNGTSDNTITMQDVLEETYIRMEPAPAGILLGSIILESIVHWVIHRSKYVKEKWWAVLSIWVYYVIVLLTMILAESVFYPYDYDDKLDLYDASYFVITIMGLSILLIFFSGVPFSLYFLWWIIVAVLYSGIGIFVSEEVRKRLAGADDNMEEDVKRLTLMIADYRTESVLIFIDGLVLIIGAYLREIGNRKTFLRRVLMIKQQQQIIEEKSKSETMHQDFLENILPPSIVEGLQKEQLFNTKDSLMRKPAFASLSRRHRGVSMLYADLVGFTAFCKEVDPFQVMQFLNDLFFVFDGLCDEFNVYKMETVGDCYVAAVGVVTGEVITEALPVTPVGSGNVDVEPAAADSCVLGSEPNLSFTMRLGTASALNATDLLSFAKAILRGSRNVIKPEVNTPATLRIGIHTGSCISGILGRKNFKYSLLGDDVDLAASLEKTGRPDHIHASQDMVDLLPNERWEACSLSSSGKKIIGVGGDVLQTFLLSV